MTDATEAELNFTRNLSEVTRLSFFPERFRRKDVNNETVYISLFN
jgi:hypothetical protein